MANFGDMKTRIADEVADSTITSQIAKAIQTAIAFHERKEFWFNHKVGTFSTVIDQEYYGSAANTDIPNIIRLMPGKVTEGGYKYDLNIVPFSQIDSDQDGTLKGRPEFAAYFNKQIRLFRIPEAVHVVTIPYVYRLTALSADADTNAWTEDAEELIRQRAKIIIASDVLRDSNIYQAAREMEREALDVLMKETRSRRSVNTLRTDLPAGGRYNIYTDE